MSEGGDFTPVAWSDYNFGSDARSHYREHEERHYQEAVETGKSLQEVLEPSIVTRCRRPLILWQDVTGSMKNWPGIIFGKLGYLYKEAQEYLGNDTEIIFGAVGDAHTDRYPLQLRKPAKDEALLARLKELLTQEKGGGSGIEESYELAALYTLYKIEMPKAIQPICIITGDEMPSAFVDQDHAERIVGVRLKKRLTTEELFAELKRKVAIYFIQKPYEESSSNTMSSVDREVFNRWAKLIGSDHIAHLPAPERVVDVIFGVLAEETGRVKYFRDEIKGRQTPEQVATVLKALETIHHEPAAKTSRRSSHSVIRGDEGDSANCESLI